MTEERRGNEFVRHTDPETSHDAIPARERREIIEVALLRAYARAYPDGLTDEEAMIGAGFDLIEDGHRRRCGTLREAKEATPTKPAKPAEIEWRGEKRGTGRTGKDRMVCYITEAGADRLDRVDGLL